MAVTFLQKRKIQRYLIPIFIILILITIIVIWRGFFVKEEPILPEKVLIPPKKIEIDFGVLKSPVLEELQPFEEIKPFEEVVVEGEVIEKLGRENPFLPY